MLFNGIGGVSEKKKTQTKEKKKNRGVFVVFSLKTPMILIRRVARFVFSHIIMHNRHFV